MAKPNYGFAKRQRDLAKKQKKEEKLRKKAAAKLDANGVPVEGDTPAEDIGSETPAAGDTPAST
jgi:hypothetical protein